MLILCVCARLLLLLASAHVSPRMPMLVQGGHVRGHVMSAPVAALGEHVPHFKDGAATINGMHPGTEAVKQGEGHCTIVD